MKELSLHLLDVAENSISAGAHRIKIVVSEDTTLDRLQMSVEDDGCGMSAELLSQVTDPFVTSRTTRKVGLGIPFLKFAAESCNGHFEISSEQGKGTKLFVEFQRSHIDRMPMGDIATTMLHLIIANPQINWIFEYGYNGSLAVFDDALIKKELGDIPMTEPDILNCLKEMIESTILEVNPQFTEDAITIQY